MKSLFIGLLITTSVFANGLTEEETSLALAKVARVYAPILKQEQGMELNLISQYSDLTVGGHSLTVNTELRVYINGGLARFEGLTQDALSLIVCRELGTFLGGAPYRDHQTVSVVGQAEYFATLKCFRKVFGSEDNSKVMKDVAVPAVVAKACKNSFTKQQEAALCMRGSMAAKVVAEIVAKISGKAVPKFETPDLTKVRVTNPNHSTLQCRLDTFFAGAICNAHVDDNVSPHDVVTGTCHRSLGHTVGLRPACWFKE